MEEESVNLSSETEFSSFQSNTIEQPITTNESKHEEIITKPINEFTESDKILIEEVKEIEEKGGIITPQLVRSILEDLNYNQPNIVKYISSVGLKQISAYPYLNILSDEESIKEINFIKKQVHGIELQYIFLTEEIGVQLYHRKQFNCFCLNKKPQLFGRTSHLSNIYCCCSGDGFMLTPIFAINGNNYSKINEELYKSSAFFVKTEKGIFNGNDLIEWIKKIFIPHIHQLRKQNNYEGFCAFVINIFYYNGIKPVLNDLKENKIKVIVSPMEGFNLRHPLNLLANEWISHFPVNIFNSSLNFLRMNVQSFFDRCNESKNDIKHWSIAFFNKSEYPEIKKMFKKPNERKKHLSKVTQQQTPQKELINKQKIEKKSRLSETSKKNRKSHYSIQIKNDVEEFMLNKSKGNHIGGNIVNSLAKQNGVEKSSIIKDLKEHGITLQRVKLIKLKYDKSWKEECEKTIQLFDYSIFNILQIQPFLELIYCIDQIGIEYNSLSLNETEIFTYSQTSDPVQRTRDSFDDCIIGCINARGEIIQTITCCDKFTSEQLSLIYPNNCFEIGDDFQFTKQFLWKWFNEQFIKKVNQTREKLQLKQHKEAFVFLHPFNSHFIDQNIFEKNNIKPIYISSPLFDLISPMKLINSKVLQEIIIKNISTKSMFCFNALYTIWGMSEETIQSSFQQFLNSKPQQIVSLIQNKIDPFILPPINDRITHFSFAHMSRANADILRSIMDTPEFKNITTKPIQYLFFTSKIPSLIELVIPWFTSSK
ncbi:hypothetical protein ENUP19_0219G0018 [Entamoeba nuttalli]|uniref:Uncharacterized protein n=2 Tax=Entamoeba nuttalli TaxID=412467 RepID=K2G5M1_ENTNP|nr:hypothetical protein ENU1_191370 [Entamoeba nuttalli P19]EKE37621.1 hypothetical protein ENU1_191370 [Entamoeba nuttalli P19]|eukprot:XP_008860049.1 hypothetical protein ENU1_191370 [Entamoeba nuttalli P19]